MEISSDVTPFTDLPQAMVQEMFDSTTNLANKLSVHLSKIHTEKEKIRNSLKDLIRNDSEILRVPQFPTTAGTDGSYCSNKLLATDIVAASAVAVEGLVPPKLTEPIWPRPRHFVKIESLAHDDANMVWARAIMFSMEMQLAALAPHTVVFLDGSMTTITIAYNQAFGHDKNNVLAEYLLNGDTSNTNSDQLKFAPLQKTLQDYRDILASKRTDKMTVAIPKYSKRNEICEKIAMQDIDDKGLLSLVLHSGEFTKPLKLIKEGGGKWLTSQLPDNVSSIVAEIESLLNEIYVVYYKPYENFPALRLECSKEIAESDARLALLLEAVKLQSGSPGMMEPYPIYLADRMVKHLSTALPAIRSFSVSEIASKWKGNVADVYLATHSYRTEGYR